MISLARLRRDLQVTPDQEDSLADTKASVVALWEQVTNRLWASRTGYVEEIRPTITTEDTLRLRLSPVSAVTLVEERAAGSSTWDAVDSTDYAVQAPDRLVRLTSVWGPEVRVTYSGGYADDAAPADVLMALVSQMRFQGARLGQDRIAVRGQTVQGGGATFLEDGFLAPFFRKLAARYRRVGV